MTVSGQAGIVPDFDQCPSNHAEILHQGRGKPKELLECQAAIKLAVGLQSKQTQTAGPAGEQSIR